MTERKTQPKPKTPEGRKVQEAKAAEEQARLQREQEATAREQAAERKAADHASRQQGSTENYPRGIGH